MTNISDFLSAGALIVALLSLWFSIRNKMSTKILNIAQRRTETLEVINSFRAKTQILIWDNANDKKLIDSLNDAIEGLTDLYDEVKNYSKKDALIYFEGIISGINKSKSISTDVDYLLEEKSLLKSKSASLKMVNRKLDRVLKETEKKIKNKTSKEIK